MRKILPAGKLTTFDGTEYWLLSTSPVPEDSWEAKEDVLRFPVVDIHNFIEQDKESGLAVYPPAVHLSFTKPFVIKWGCASLPILIENPPIENNFDISLKNYSPDEEDIIDEDEEEWKRVLEEENGLNEDAVDDMTYQWRGEDTNVIPS